MRRYLEVNFNQKDIVKALGARFDYEKKQWFIPEGMDQERFKRWLPKNEQGIIENTVSDKDTIGEDLSTPKFTTLSSLLFEVGEGIRKALPSPKWVKVEIAQIKENKASGHWYIELVEHNELGREIAKVNAKIWKSNNRIIKKFEKDTGIKIEDGMQLMVLVCVEFSVQYGLSVTIEEISVSWTLGEMEKKMLHIREKLKSEGIFDLNKNKVMPFDFSRVLVIAPEGAAGLGDFNSDATHLIDKKLCAFHFMYAVFEGPTAHEKIIEQMKKLSETKEQWDCLVIIRGGGSKTSLNWLNEESLAREICLCPIPVLTGIGHERDKTILDEVSCKSFDTPSKVIGFIREKIVNNANEIRAHWKSINQNLKWKIESEKNKNEKWWIKIKEESMHYVQNESQKNNILWSGLLKDANFQLKKSKGCIEQWITMVIMAGPQKILNRGYALVRNKNGQIIKGAHEVKNGESVLIELKAGHISAKIEKE